jgi:hypothetical protein
MLHARRLLLGLALLCAGVPANAAVIIDVVMTPTEILGTPPFGLGGLPATPFTASFTLDALPVNFDSGLDVTDFTATIGNQTWERDDIVRTDRGSGLRDIFVQTDATGAVLTFLADVLEGDAALTIRFAPELGLALWAANDGPFCADVSESACIQGTVTVSTRVVAEVPEPATLVLMAAGLAAVMAARRRQLRSVA